MLNINVIRQSVYWITGSFNYVYPLFMLFWYWYVLLKFSKDNFKGKKLLLASILAFFASATVEQGGMISFGLTVLFFLYKFIINKRNKNVMTRRSILAPTVILICSLIGVVTVICSPAQFIRFGLESKENFNITTSFKNGINFLIYVFINSRLYKPHIILLLFTVFLSFITIKKSNKLSCAEIFILVSAVISGTGSQIMMLVSPVFGERNTLFGIFMIILFTALLISHLPKTKNNFLIFIKSGFYIFLITIATINIFNIYKGYKLTNEIQKKNIEIINEYKKIDSNEKIELFKFHDDRFGWSMPYVSKYHEHWFKIYYEIPNAEITWKDYTK